MKSKVACLALMAALVLLFSFPAAAPAAPNHASPAAAAAPAPPRPSRDACSGTRPASGNRRRDPVPASRQGPPRACGPRFRRPPRRRHSCRRRSHSPARNLPQVLIHYSFSLSGSVRGSVPATLPFFAPRISCKELASRCAPRNRAEYNGPACKPRAKRVQDFGPAHRFCGYPISAGSLAPNLLSRACAPFSRRLLRISIPRQLRRVRGARPSSKDAYLADPSRLQRHGTSSWPHSFCFRSVIPSKRKAPARPRVDTNTPFFTLREICSPSRPRSPSPLASPHALTPPRRCPGPHHVARTLSTRTKQLRHSRNVGPIPARLSFGRTLYRRRPKSARRSRTSRNGPARPRSRSRSCNSQPLRLRPGIT